MVFAHVSSLFTARSIVSPKQGEGGDCDGHFEVGGRAGRALHCGSWTSSAWPVQWHFYFTLG